MENYISKCWLFCLFRGTNKDSIQLDSSWFGPSRANLSISRWAGCPAMPLPGSTHRGGATAEIRWPFLKATGVFQMYRCTSPALQLPRQQCWFPALPAPSTPSLAETLQSITVPISAAGLEHVVPINSGFSGTSAGPAEPQNLSRV